MDKAKLAKCVIPLRSKEAEPYAHQIIKKIAVQHRFPIPEIKKEGRNLLVHNIDPRFAANIWLDLPWYVEEYMEFPGLSRYFGDVQIHEPETQPLQHEVTPEP